MKIAVFFIVCYFIKDLFFNLGMAEWQNWLSSELPTDAEIKELQWITNRELLQESLSIPQISKPQNINFCSALLNEDLLSLQEIRRESMTQKKPNGIELPIFDNYESFIASDFFKKYYDLWIRDLRVKSLWDIVEWKPHPDEYDTEWYSGPVWWKNLLPANEYDARLQRMLLVLWYLKLNDFSLEEYIDGERHESEVSTFWILWKNENRAIREFQKNYELETDGIVGEYTKEVLYHLVYYFFHSRERFECIKKSREYRKNIFWAQ